MQMIRATIGVALGLLSCGGPSASELCDAVQLGDSLAAYPVVPDETLNSTQKLLVRRSAHRGVSRGSPSLLSGPYQKTCNEMGIAHCNVWHEGGVIYGVGYFCQD